MDRLIWGLAVLFVAFETAESQAQSFTLISYEWVGSDLDEEAPDADLKHYSSAGVGAAVPMTLPKGRLIAGVRYDRIQYSFDNRAVSTPELKTLHHPRLELILERTLSASWQLTLMASPGFASDFNAKLGGGDFNMSLAALASKKWSDRMIAGLGLSYVKDRSPVVLPVVQISWQSGGDWYAEAVAPASAHLWYARLQMFELGLAWRGVFRPYNLNDASNGATDWLLRRQVFSLGPALRVPLAGKVALQIEAGRTLRNRLVYISDLASYTFDHAPNFILWMGLVLTAN